MEKSKPKIHWTKVKPLEDGHFQVDLLFADAPKKTDAQIYLRAKCNIELRPFRGRGKLVEYQRAALDALREALTDESDEIAAL